MNYSVFETLRESLDSGVPVAMATIVRGAPEQVGRGLLIRQDGGISGSLEHPDLEAKVKEHALAMLQGECTAIVQEGDVEVFLESILPPSKLIIVGGVHIAIPLATIAKSLDYQAILIDPRPAFATVDRFPHVDRLIRKWPEEAFAEVGIDAGTCVAILTHDPKIDDPAVKLALQNSPAYIGVLGSRKTHEKRIKRLLADGLSQEQLSRLHAPIGLNLGGRTPAEIAVSIMAEIIACRRQP